jgi:hypothetical protein
MSEPLLDRPRHVSDRFHCPQAGSIHDADLAETRIPSFKNEDSE